MTLTDVVKVLPEFGNQDEEKFNTFIENTLKFFPDDEYIDEEIAKVYFVAKEYFESQKRTRAMENMGIKSEKIDDIQTAFGNVMSEENPYAKLFETMRVANHQCDYLSIGFMCAD